MKYLWGSLLSLLIIIVIASNIKTHTFVPFKNKTSRIIDYTIADKTTLKKYHFKLKWFVPNLKKIDKIEDLKNNEVILLPWNTTVKDLIHIKVNNVSFFESNHGAVQIKTFSRNNDGYEKFLNKKITLTAAGTVVLARGVHKSIQRKNDVFYPWKNTKHLFATSDINIVNFKSPLITDFKYPKSSWLLIGKSIYAKGIKDANIHLVSISGNHMGDAKERGLLETIKTLNKYNIETVGAGKTIVEAYRCKKIKKKNITFGFLGFNNVHGSIGKPNKKSSGIAWLDNQALDAIKNCNNQVDQLIVMVNWGIEYTHIPRNKEKKWANKMIEAGADLILGDQAHWVQIHETISGKHVSYGLGNYIFDQHWSEKTTEGIIQKFIFFENKLMFVDTIPIKLAKDGSINVIKPTSERFFNVLDAYYGNKINKKYN